MRKHSPEQRKEYRERINRVKPWLKSTGAKTPEGKERSKMNALKIPLEVHQLYKECNQIIKQQKELMNMIIV